MFIQFKKERKKEKIKGKNKLYVHIFQTWDTDHNITSVYSALGQDYS